MEGIREAFQQQEARIKALEEKLKEPQPEQPIEPDPIEPIPEPEPDKEPYIHPEMRWVPPKLKVGETKPFGFTSKSQGRISVSASYSDIIRIEEKDGVWYATGMKAARSNVKAIQEPAYPYKGTTMTTTIQVEPAEGGEPAPEPETQPEEPTPVEPLPEEPRGTVVAETAWVGAVATTEATIKTRLSENKEASLQMSLSSSFDNPFTAATGTGDPEKDYVISLRPKNLKPNQRYYYKIKVDGELAATGSFRTYPAPGTDFEFLAASCSGKGSKDRISGAPILKQLPKQFPNAVTFVHMGDLHYSDNNQNNPQLWRDAFKGCYLEDSYRDMYSYWGMPYTRDDHDFCNNNSHSQSTGAPASNRAYREYVPNYPFQQSLKTGVIPRDDGTLAAGQTWAMGSIRVIMLDCRTKKVLTGPGKTLLGRQQMEWFKETLAYATEPAIMIVSGSVYIMRPDSPHLGDFVDSWGQYPEEREEIANFLMAEENKRNGVRLNDRCFILHGDAHQIAIDNGTNSQFAKGYSGATHKGPPVFCFAALDASNSQKGGPYSEGLQSGTRQFGRVFVKHESGRLKIKGIAMMMYHGTNVMKEVFTHELDLPDIKYTVA